MQKHHMSGLAELRKAKEAASSPKGKMSMQGAKKTISRLHQIVETQAASLEML
jgi:hypothetical protein